MLSQQCELLEQLDATNQRNLMHAQIRKTIGAHKRNATTTYIADKHGSITMDQDKIRTHWFEYISELYTDDSRGQLPHITPDTADIPITSEEIQHALKIIPMKKAPGPDGGVDSNASCRWRVWAGRAYQAYKYGVQPCLFPRGTE